MDKARLLLMNLDFGIFPKACIHKEISEVGWLLYSTRQQNEERFSELIYNLVNQTIMGPHPHQQQIQETHQEQQLPHLRAPLRSSNR
jgi:hypothetical protein